MWRLNRKLRRLHNDRGATALLVALLISIFALGIGAVVSDAGSWYAERAQLQNGADAGALVMAHQCASSACPAKLDSNGRTQVAIDRANSNANDNFANVDYICGNGTGLNACTAAQTRGCPNAPVLSGGGSPKYVDVHTSTQTSSGSLVPPILGRQILHDDSWDGRHLKACAQAAWGPPKISGDILAFSIAECVWNGATIGGTNYAPDPPAVPTPGFAYERALVVHLPSDPVDPACVSGPNVGLLPGGFGWTTTTSNCTTIFNAVGNGWYQVDPGQGTQTGSGCGTGGGGANGVIPCARNPVVPFPPFPSGGTSTCPTPPTPSPLLVPVYNQVCVQPGTSAANEVQTVTLTNARSGTFTLTFANATTSALAFNATAAQVQAALQSLSTIGAGNVVVDPASPAGGPYVVKFQNALASQDVAQMTADGTALRPNTGPGNTRASITVATTTQGSNSATGCPAGFANGKYFHLTTLAAFVVTGYNGVPGISPSKSSWLTGRSYCVSPTGSDPPCLMGYFVKAVVDGGEIGDGGDTGVTVVKLTG